MQDDQKPWYMSKTILAGAAIVAMGIFGVDADSDMFAMVKENSGDIITAVLGLLTIWGRLTAKAPVAVKTMQQPTPSDYVPMPMQPNTQLYQPYAGPGNVDDARG